jgi:hypothetical protein
VACRHTTDGRLVAGDEVKVTPPPPPQREMRRNDT